MVEYELTTVARFVVRIEVEDSGHAPSVTPIPVPVGPFQTLQIEKVRDGSKIQVYRISRVHIYQIIKR
jgi:hypothetical protein